MGLNHLLPLTVRRRLAEKLFAFVRQQLSKQEADFPTYRLTEAMLADTTVVVDRQRLLQLLPRGGTVAELGVDQGHFSQEILDHNQPSKLTLVDPWHTSRFGSEKMRHVQDRFAQQIGAGTVEVIRGLSTEVHAQLAEASLDWVYIDSIHDYATTLKELRLWAPKVKPDGYLAGHDYIIANWKGLVRYGVIEAVAQFCQEEGWGLAYLTMDQPYPQSFALRRLKG